MVIQASENARSLLRLDRDPLGARLDDLVPILAARIRPRLGDTLAQIPLVLRTPVGRDPERDFDAIVHRPPAGGLVVELEPSGPTIDLAGQINAALQTIIASASLRSLCDDAARIFKTISGYDRVMVYRFDDEGHGEVFPSSASPSSRPTSETVIRIPISLESLVDSTSATESVSWSMSITHRCASSPGHRPSRGRIWTCPCAACAACRRSTSSI